MSMAKTRSTDQIIIEIGVIIELRAMASNILWKYPEPGYEARRAEARKRIDDSGAKLLELMREYVKIHDDSIDSSTSA
jgi:hypothetical protein